MAADEPIGGFAAPGYAAVCAAFAANFQRAGADSELGAALAVHVDGECVVDLWGGYADVAKTRQWQADTLANIWSATKGVVALAVAMLADRGLLSYDDPVARHWPEFAQAGKADITVAQLMSHQAGLNGFDAPTSLADFLDWARVTERLAVKAPAWEPGTMASYHAMTYGFLAGELIRRVSGLTPGDFIATEITGPLGADLHVGLPPALEPRVAEMAPPSLPPGGLSTALDPMAARAVDNPRVDPLWPHRRDWRAGQVPAANGQASARGLGRIYGAIAAGGALDGVRLISPEGIAAMARTRHPGPDRMLGPRHWAAGMASHLAPTFGPDPTTFGHTGWGGAFGCANTARRVGIGYVMNRMGTQLTGNPRGTSLCMAIFAAAEAAQRKAGQVP